MKKYLLLLVILLVVISCSSDVKAKLNKIKPNETEISAIIYDTNEEFIITDEKVKLNIIEALKQMTYHKGINSKSIVDKRPQKHYVILHFRTSNDDFEVLVWYDEVIFSGDRWYIIFGDNKNLYDYIIENKE